jgi:hypothetical protein
MSLACPSRGRRERSTRDPSEYHAAYPGPLTLLFSRLQTRLRASRHVDAYTELWKDIDISEEDTFLLLDALEEDVDSLRQSKPAICLEIGYVERSSIDFSTYIMMQIWIWMCVRVPSKNTRIIFT